MKSLFRAAALTAALCLVLSITACGKGSEPDGIDSVTLLSEYDKTDSSPDTAGEAGQTAEDAFSFRDSLGKELAVSDNGSFSSSLYLLFLNEALTDVADTYDISPDEALSVEVLLQDGSVTPCSEYCRKYADTEFRWACLLYSYYTNEGHTLETCPSYADAALRAEAAYRSDVRLYSSLKISLGDLVLYHLYHDLYDDLFRVMYSPGGSCRISTEDLSGMMEQGMRKIRYTYLPFYDDESQERLSDEEIARYTQISQNYLERFRKGEPFADIVRENYVFLDSFNFSPDPEKVDVYYSVYSPDLPPSIVECAEELPMYEAAFLLEEDFTSVVQRVPVNETMDDDWLAHALQLARDSDYGTGYEITMTEAYDTFPLQMDEKVHAVLTAENLLAFLTEQE